MPYTEKQMRMLRNKAGGGRGIGPSQDVAEKMLKHANYSRFTSRGRDKAAEMSSKKGTQRAKDNVERRENESRKKRRMKVIEQAMKGGYKRQGGLGRKLVEGLKGIKKLQDD